MSLGSQRGGLSLKPVAFGAIIVVGLSAGLAVGIALGSDPTVESVSITTGTTARGTTAASSGCDIPPGEPFVGGPTVDLVDLGGSEGVRVEGVRYPRPDYEGNPWTQWGQGIVLPDGRFVSGIGDQLGPDGNSYLYEYNPEAGTLTMLGDILSYVDHVPGTWGYGKIHGQMVSGPCGEIYFSTYWGSYRGLEFEGDYRGDILFRLDPYGRTLSPLGVPVDLHGQASLASAPTLGLVFGESIDPVLKEQGVDQGPLFVYDVQQEEIVFLGPESPHVGFRSILVDSRGRAYYSVGDGELAIYDPESGELDTHPATLPGNWLRAVTEVADDGSVYGVTREPDVFFALRPNGEIVDLGAAEGYTTSLALTPDGDDFFYMPGAHGNAWKLGGALTRVNTSTGRQEVVVKLNPLVEEGLGLTVGGTYNVAVSPDGKTVYVGANVSPLGDDSGFGEVVLLVVHLP